MIRLVTLGASPTVSTLAGTGALGLVNGPPLSAKFREPSGIAFAGTIFVADAGNDVIRAIAPDATPTGLPIYPAGATLNPGVTVLLSARVNYTDGHMVDVSASAIWSSSNTAIATVSAIGLVSAVATGDAAITATSGSFRAMVTIHVVAPDALPPDPALIAPPIDPTKISTVYETTRFLYEGTPRVQTGVAPGTIERVRASVIRGPVMQRGGGALSGVRITILDHPEYGSTLSRADGNFDIVVNGGGPLTVQYRKDGYIAADRQVAPNGNDFAVAPSVTLVPYSRAPLTATGYWRRPHPTDLVVVNQKVYRRRTGRITSRTEAVAGATTTQGFTYDAAGRLSDVTTNGSLVRHYDYDANRNRTAIVSGSTSVTASCDAQDRLTTFGDVSYQYAPNGELSERTDASGTTQYVYDEIGNLVQARLADGRIIDYLIDAQNRRVGRNIDGVVDHRWLYASALRPAAEVSEAGDVISRFIYATHVNVPDLMIRGDGDSGSFWTSGEGSRACASSRRDRFPAARNCMIAVDTNVLIIGHIIGVNATRSAFPPLLRGFYGPHLTASSSICASASAQR